MKKSFSCKKVSLISDDGMRVTAVAPVILSASRSTDIPAFFADWFMHRLDVGYSRWINSFNPGLPYYVSFQDTRAIVFWSKNPKPLLYYLNLLDATSMGYYIQYTLNDYEPEGFEPGLPPLSERIDTFIRLSQRLGRDRVIWRFDPILLTDRLDISGIIARIRNIGSYIAPYTKKLVFSFVELKYAKVKRQSERYHFRTLSPDEKLEFVSRLHALNQDWNLVLASCADHLPYPGIEQNKCVDDRLLRTICAQDIPFITYLDTHSEKDPGQRPACSCIQSKDIGQYHTCLHGCVYCYATDHEQAVRHFQRHQQFPDADTITGEKPPCTTRDNTSLTVFYEL